jgi:tetratricopeptide (TPR) repeat protein
MTTNTIQAALLDLLEQARDERQAWIESIPEAEWQATGTPEQWSLKDDLAHMAFWDGRSAERIAAALRGDAPAEGGPGFQEINERVFEERRGWTWAQVLDDAERSHAALIDHVRALGDAALTEARAVAGGGERTIAADLLGNGYWHIIEHVARSYAARGQLERAERMLDRAIVANDQLKLLPNDHATALYNLACFYATIGQPDKALPLLPEALRLRPDLVEWSKQDSDLDSLRDRADFQALYQGL